MVNNDILVIYPETVSTQIALYKASSLLFLKNIKHRPEDLSQLKEPDKKLEFRTNAVMRELEDNDADIQAIEYVVGRGGFGKVWKVQLKRNGKYYALKEMSKAL